VNTSFDNLIGLSSRSKLKLVGEWLCPLSHLKAGCPEYHRNLHLIHRLDFGKPDRPNPGQLSRSIR
jgi:hypothetical protein